MTDFAIKTEGLWKEYILGEATTRSDTFYDQIASTLAAPFRRLRRLSGQADAEYRFWALRDVSFEVKPGEVVGIIGPNGAGKSTLLKILSRITVPTRGRAFIRGRLSSLLEVGTGFHPELTGRDNIYLNGSILGMSRAEVSRKLDQIIDFAGVEKFVDTPVKRYSSGMYVRLAFSVAAHLETDILIVDEVLSVGDAAFQKKSLGKMEGAARSGRTVIFVSHNLAAVRALCSKVLVLRDGQSFFEGEVGEGIDRYLARELRAGIKTGILNEDGRTGTGNVRYRSIEVNSHAHNIVRIGGDLDLKLCVKVSADSYVRAVTAGVTFRNSLELPVFHSTNLITGDMLKIKPGESGFISFRIPRLTLIPGRYRLALSLGSQNEVFDYLPEAIEIDVVEDDFYGSGRLPPSTSSTCVMDAKWLWSGCSA
jgi:lipopolysaccharide transport system ATP-binding protein